MYIGGAQFVVGAELGLGASSGRAGPINVGTGQVAGATTTIGNSVNTNKIGSLTIIDAAINPTTTTGTIQLGNLQTGTGVLDIGNNGARTGAINIGANSCDVNVNGILKTSTPATKINTTQVPTTSWVNTFFATIDSLAGYGGLSTTNTWNVLQTFTSGINVAGTGISVTIGGITTNTLSSTGLITASSGITLGGTGVISGSTINISTNSAIGNTVNVGWYGTTTTFSTVNINGQAKFNNITPQCSVDPTFGDELANKGYVDRVVGNYSGNGLFLYFNIPGPITNPITSPLTGLTTQVLGQTLVPMNASNAALYYTLQTTSIGTSTLIASFMTASGYPNTTSIPSGIWSMLVYGYVSSTTGTVFYHFDVYEVDAAGVNVKQLGGDSTKSNDVNAVTASDPDAYHCSLTMPLAITLTSTTSRIKVNIYVTGAGLAAGTNLFTYFGGTYYSFITSTLSASTALLTANNTWTGTNEFSVRPTAPTAAAGTNTTELATTAFVNASIILSNPVGTIIMHAGIATPTGYLYCDGSLVSTTTYSQLFAVIGTNYGSGTGTFAVPNFKEKFPLGAANMSTLFSALGNTTGGSFVISAANLPAHNHTASFTGTNQFVTQLTSTTGDGTNSSRYANAIPTSRTVATGTVTVNNNSTQNTQYYPPYTTINYFIKF